MRYALWAAVVVAITMSWAHARADSIQIPPPITVQELPPGTEVRPLSFTRMVAKLNRGQAWGNIQVGLLCLPGGSLTWKGGRMDIKIEDFDDVLRDEMSKAGFKVEGDPNNLFEQPTSTSEYAIAGSITNIQAKFCAPMAGFGDFNSVKGSALIDMDWQIYSRLEKRVIAKVRTQGGAQIKNSAPGNFENIVFAAFAENVKGLINAPEFRTTYIGSGMPASALAQPSRQPLIEIHGPSGGVRSIADAASAVVIVFAGEGHGSGFLVSNDGLLITDQHVVGVAKYVKIRWADGVETFGEVIRSDKVRDVALIKTDPRGRLPLQIRKEQAQPGETVFAIGAPLDQKFQSTVTRGIVSATRTFDGLSYVQSDVAVLPGNSGGPLLDEKGNVVAITESGYRLGSAPVDLNLFTPVRDALDFLSADLR